MLRSLRDSNYTFIFINQFFRVYNIFLALPFSCFIPTLSSFKRFFSPHLILDSTTPTSPTCCIALIYLYFTQIDIRQISEKSILLKMQIVDINIFFIFCQKVLKLVVCPIRFSSSIRIGPFQAPYIAGSTKARLLLVRSRVHTPLPCPLSLLHTQSRSVYRVYSWRGILDLNPISCNHEILADRTQPETINTTQRKYLGSILLRIQFTFRRK